jgi:MFS family permease
LLSLLRQGPLAEREFRILFLGRLVSFLCGAIASIALAFAVLDLTGSKSDLGLVLAARSLPQVVFLLAGGVWADRLPRHLVMVSSNVVSAASQGLVAALLLSGRARIWELAALAAVNGTGQAFFFPASTGIVPQTVPTAMLQSANSLLRLGINSTTIGGTALGGALVAATSPGIGLAIDSVSFLLAAFFLWRMRLPGTARIAGSRFVAELADGWREFRSRPWLWSIVLQFGIVNGVWVGCESVLGPAIAKEHLGGAAGWGAVLASQSIGFVLGGLIFLRLRPQRILLVATLGFLLTAGMLPALAIPLPLYGVGVAAFVAGVGLETFGIFWDTAIQQEIPADRLSRVSSYDALGSFVLIPLGLAAAGPAADWLGTAATLWGATCLIVVSTLAVLFVEDVRTIRRRLSPVSTTD